MKIKKRFITSFAALTILSISIFGSSTTEVEVAAAGHPGCIGVGPCVIA
ncbi:hypothetical protein [Viridibacillus arvi]